MRAVRLMRLPLSLLGIRDVVRANLWRALSVLKQATKTPSAEPSADACGWARERAVRAQFLVAIVILGVTFIGPSAALASPPVGSGTFGPSPVSMDFAPAPPPTEPDRLPVEHAAVPNTGATVTGNWYTGAVDSQGQAVDAWDFEPNAQGVLTGTAILPVAIVGCEVPSGSSTWENFLSQPDGEYFGGVLGYSEKTCIPGATPAPGAAMREFTVSDGTSMLEISENESELATSQTIINADGSVSDTSPFWCFRLGRSPTGPTAVPPHACVNANAVSASSYVALGDSVAAGEGIGYGWFWNVGAHAWEGGDSSGVWDSVFEPDQCHQTPQGYPHVAATTLGVGLKDFACTGASTFNGVLGERVNTGLFGFIGNWSAPAQLGSSIGLPSAEPPNPEYDAAKPDLVSVTLGADDVNFTNIVSTCYKGPCDTNIHSLDGPLAEEASNLSLVLDEVRRRGVDDGRIPLVVVTQYYDPFPAYDWSCHDINPGYPLAWLSREQMEFLVSGLARLNHNIAQVAAAEHILVLNTSSLFKDHRFCSPNGPWVYGPSIRLTGFPPDINSQAPFHPTPEGQQAIGDALANLVSDKLPVNVGANVHVTLPWGRLAFADVARSGEAAIIPANGLPGSVPTSNTFAMASAFEVTTSADYSGDITVSLPSTKPLDLYHYIGGAWRQVASTFDGTYVSGVVSSLSPFALGTPVSPVHAKLDPVSGGQAPVNMQFDASGSSVEDGSGIASYEWDFGDQQAGGGPAPTHRYAQSGTYQVTVTVTAVDGAVDTASTQVIVTNVPPQAVLAGPASGEVGQTLSYDSSESSDPNGSVVGELWEFGDGSVPVAGAQASHAYSSPGTYQVTLIVRDDEGAPNSVTLSVTVTAPRGSGATTTRTHGVLSSVEAERPAVRIASKLARDRHGRVLLTVSCAVSAGVCRGTVTLQVRRHGKLKVIGRAGYAIGAGRTARVAVSLIKPLAKAARVGSLAVNVVATVHGGVAVAASCRLAAPSIKRAPHHK